MKMPSSGVIRSMVIAIALSCAAGRLVGQTLNEPDIRAAQSAPRPKGFFDYALLKVNPHDKNYGASIESTRNAIVGYTIDDLYFWSNVVTLLLLSGLVAIVLFEWRVMDKRELIAASLIAQLWNGRVSDRIEIERRTRQFNQLVEDHNAETEGALSRASTSSKQETDTNRSLTRSVRTLAESNGISPAEAEKIAAGAPDAIAASLEHSNLLLQKALLQESAIYLKAFGGLLIAKSL